MTRPSKAVKLPGELLDLLEQDGISTNQGAHLLETYKDYLRLVRAAERAGINARETPADALLRLIKEMRGALTLMEVQLDEVQKAVSGLAALKRLQEQKK
jgi:hypothetical protein